MVGFNQETKQTIDKIVKELGLGIHERVVNGNFTMVLLKNKGDSLRELHDRVLDYFSKYYSHFSTSQTFDNGVLTQIGFRYKIDGGMEQLRIYIDGCRNILLKQISPQTSKQTPAPSIEDYYTLTE